MDATVPSIANAHFFIYYIYNYVILVEGSAVTNYLRI
jgi:hypothetical protein